MLSKKWLKIFCVAYNFLFIFTGFLLITCSSVLLYRCHWYNSFIIADIYKPLLLLEFIGILILFLSCLGWKAITREHRPHVILLCGFIVVLVSVEFLTSIWSAFVYYQFPDESKNLMKFSFSYHKNNTKTGSHAGVWNRVQKELACCGLTGPNEYHELLPTSCCVSPNSSHVGACSAIYQRGCLDPFQEYISRQLLTGIFLALGVAALQFCGIFCTYSYSKALKPVPRQTETLMRQPSLPQAASVSPPPVSSASPTVPMPMPMPQPSTAKSTTSPDRATAPEKPLLANKT